jgi:hypothetical protein
MTASVASRFTNRKAIWLGVAVLLLLVIGANSHLVYMAVTTQPECVAHQILGTDDAAAGSFSAAQSACSSAPLASAANPE